MAYQANISVTPMINSLARFEQEQARKRQEEAAKRAAIGSLVGTVAGGALGVLGGPIGVSIGAGLGGGLGQVVGGAVGPEGGAYALQGAQQMTNAAMQGAGQVMGQRQQFGTAKAAAAPQIAQLLGTVNQDIQRLESTPQAVPSPLAVQPMQPAAPVEISPITGAIAPGSQQAIDAQQNEQKRQDTIGLAQLKAQPAPQVQQQAPQQIQQPNRELQLNQLYAQRDELEQLAGYTPFQARQHQGGIYDVIGKYKTLAADRAQSQELGLEMAKKRMTSAHVTPDQIVKANERIQTEVPKLEKQLKASTEEFSYKGNKLRQIKHGASLNNGAGDNMMVYGMANYQEPGLAVRADDKAAVAQAFGILNAAMARAKGEASAAWDAIKKAAGIENDDPTPSQFKKAGELLKQGGDNIQPGAIFNKDDRRKMVRAMDGLAKSEVKNAVSTLNAFYGEGGRLSQANTRLTNGLPVTPIAPTEFSHITDAGIRQWREIGYDIRLVEGKYVWINEPGKSK